MLDRKLLIELQEYIDSHLRKTIRNICEYSIHRPEILYEEIQPIELENFIQNKRKPTFNQLLFNFIDKKGVSDPDIYKKAGIDRRHFSKIRSNPDYRPGKNTVIALALALELNKKKPTDF